MRHVLFGANEENVFHTAILIKESALVRDKISNSYLKYLHNNIDVSKIIGMSLTYNESGNAPKKFAEAYLNKLLKALEQLGVTTLLVADSNYFKALTGAKKVNAAYGSYYKCVLPGFDKFTVTYLPNYTLSFYNPDIVEKIIFCMNAYLKQQKAGCSEVGADIIKYSKYITDMREAELSLKELHKYPHLTVDIEGFSLQFHKTKVATIGFAWNKHEGICIKGNINNLSEESTNYLFNQLILDFFKTYKGTLTYHGGIYDMKVIIYNLFMKNFFDYEGMLLGIDTLTSNFEDTKLIAYLATNSTSRNDLGLKSLAQEFTGDYAQDEINDITQIPLRNLMEYNLVDCLATFYVYEKYYPRMVEDDQLEIYQNIFKPSVPVILQMELTGMPIDMNKVNESEKALKKILEDSKTVINNSSYAAQALKILRQKESDAAHAKWKKKSEPIEYFDYVEFNPNSSDHISVLIYDCIGLTPLAYTPTGKPSTSKDDIAPLLNNSSLSDEAIEVIKAYLEITEVSILLNNFINAFKNKSVFKEDGWYYLHGNFNLGGTVSGRLSSSGPNLQNIPNTGNKYAKLVKMCIAAPPGHLVTGADFASLEDRISALTTKDVNKLKVYTDGYDGHCLRAYYYFMNEMPDIEETPSSINSIKDLYPQLRQDSKAPTFLLTYGGTYHGMMNNLGWSEEKSKAIESSYHEMYKMSDQWVQDHIKTAHDVGYVTCAFGLRVRTPILAKTIYGAPKLPYEASKEQRTAGNALGQSWGLLNNRAAIELFERLKYSPYRTAILPIAHIHDAQYFLTRDCGDVVEWLNKNLVECMEWQEDPLIQHDEVKLGGELSVFYPDWSHEISLPNNADADQIIKICKEKYNDYFSQS